MFCIYEGCGENANYNTTSYWLRKYDQFYKKGVEQHPRTFARLMHAKYILEHGEEIMFQIWEPYFNEPKKKYGDLRSIKLKEHHTVLIDDTKRIQHKNTGKVDTLYNWAKFFLLSGGVFIPEDFHVIECNE